MVGELECNNCRAFYHKKLAKNDEPVDVYAEYIDSLQNADAPAGEPPAARPPLQANVYRVRVDRAETGAALRLLSQVMKQAQPEPRRHAAPPPAPSALQSDLFGEESEDALALFSDLSDEDEMQFAE